MRFVLCLAGAILASCAQSPAVEAESHAPRLQSAGGELKSWGATLHHWTMDADGKVEHTSGERVGGNRTDVVIETRRFTLSPEQRLALDNAVQRVELIIGRPEGCENQMTDGPYGTLRWSKGGEESVLPFSGNCVKGRDYDLASAVMAADAIVDDIAKAVPAAERHPL
jgi:hypothetical protein